MNGKSLPATFQLRLPEPTQRKATKAAKSDGVSLNDFILLAIAERLIRSERDAGHRRKRAS
jgi:predicted HicB family RNase H-like nuclease